jgi:hypothetical protein
VAQVGKAGVPDGAQCTGDLVGLQRGSASTHGERAWRELENAREFLSQSPRYGPPISLEKADVGLSHAKPFGQVGLGPHSFTTSIAKISAAHGESITYVVILWNAARTDVDPGQILRTQERSIAEASPNIQLASEIALGRLDGDVAQQKLALIQFAAREVAETGAGADNIPEHLRRNAISPASSIVLPAASHGSNPIRLELKAAIRHRPLTRGLVTPGDN